MGNPHSMEEYLKRHQLAYRNRTQEATEQPKNADEPKPIPADLSNCDIDELAKIDPEFASELLCKKLQEMDKDDGRTITQQEDTVRPPDSSYRECILGNLYWTPNHPRNSLSHSQHSSNSGNSNNVDSDEQDENLQAAIRQSLIEM